MPEQTYIKVLLAPAWDHNWPDGPSSWLDNNQTGSAPYGGYAPHWHYKTGRRYTNGDKYYRPAGRPDFSDDASQDLQNQEGWWPYKMKIGTHSSVMPYDADPRVFDSTGNLQSPTVSTGSGGFGGTANEAAYTKNRLLNTSIPYSSFDIYSSATIDVTIQSTGTSDTARNAHTPYANHYQDGVHDAIIQGSFDTGASAETETARLLYPNKPGTASQTTDSGNENNVLYGGQQSRKGHHAGDVWSSTGHPANKYTYGYEYTLNITDLTHSWDTITSVLPLSLIHI